MAENLNVDFDPVRTSSATAKRMLVENWQREFGVERRTGRTFNGKPTYEKDVEVPQYPDTALLQVPHGATIEDIAAPPSGVAQSAAGIVFHIPNPGTATSQITMVINGANIDIVTGNDRTAFSGFITIEYTKP